MGRSLYPWLKITSRLGKYFVTLSRRWTIFGQIGIGTDFLSCSAGFSKQFNILKYGNLIAIILVMYYQSQWTTWDLFLLVDPGDVIKIKNGIGTDAIDFKLTNFVDLEGYYYQSLIVPFETNNRKPVIDITKADGTLIKRLISPIVDLNCLYAVVGVDGHKQIYLLRWSNIYDEPETKEHPHIAILYRLSPTGKIVKSLTCYNLHRFAAAMYFPAAPSHNIMNPECLDRSYQSIVMAAFCLKRILLMPTKFGGSYFNGDNHVIAKLFASAIIAHGRFAFRTVSCVLCQHIPKDTIVPWSLPEKALFFLPESTTNWDAISADEHEWLLLDRLSQKLFMSLSPADTAISAQRGDFQTITAGSEVETAIQKQAHNEWTRALLPGWVPKSEMIVTAIFEHRGQPQNVAYCAFSRPEANVVIMGVPGRHYQIYIEQPDPLPKTQRRLTLRDILSPAILRIGAVADHTSVLPWAALTSTEYIRNRAFLPAGPYAREHIYLISLAFSETLTLGSVGY